MASISSEYLEDFIIIWPDSTIKSDDITVSERQSVLRAYSHCIRIFIDKEECFEFIRNIRDEKIFLIISGLLDQTFLPLVNDFTQLIFIHVFCADKTKHTRWCEQHRKIRGIFDDQNL
ncbi:unnamed protein product [Rotaria socialis]|uniref:Uncharacterized protein n=1 Tax=Rotaria socialis TaxID=392032 RepID=A0A821DVF5_9BILA|nr:unnamed protein product [Rotaria socialis]CAF4626942.1 unnamed protein product [Rotaria socialis]